MQHVQPPCPLNALHDWKVAAARGDSYVYFRGFLAAAADYDRDCPEPNRNSEWFASKEAANVRDMAYALHERGDVRLVQRRLAPYDYEYIAQRI